MLGLLAYKMTTSKWKENGRIKANEVSVLITVMTHRMHRNREEKKKVRERSYIETHDIPLTVLQENWDNNWNANARYFSVLNAVRAFGWKNKSSYNNFSKGKKKIQFFWDCIKVKLMLKGWNGKLKKKMVFDLNYK